MNYKRLKYIVIPNILWYVTGRFIYEKVLDMSHCLRRKPPRNSDAASCGEYFCRECGGEYYKKLNR